VEIDTVIKAISLSGTPVMGVPIIVSLTEAEKNRQAAVAAANPANFNPVYDLSLSYFLCCTYSNTFRETGFMLVR
jgi:hypothetical protein